MLVTSFHGMTEESSLPLQAMKKGSGSRKRKRIYISGDEETSSDDQVSEDHEESKDEFDSSDEDIITSRSKDDCDHFNMEANKPRVQPMQPYELISTHGTVLGKVSIINTSANENVHGRPLSKDERKVVVEEVYEDIPTEHMMEEFIQGAFLRVDKILLRKLPYSEEGSVKKGRGQKRGLSPKKWNREKTKKLRNSGEAYTNAKGKDVDAKEFKNIDCTCKHKQCHTLSIADRSRAHAEFLAMGVYDDQNAFLLTQISSYEKKTAKIPKEGVKSQPKSKTRVYHVKDTEVCKEIFKAVYGVSNGRLGRLLKKAESDPTKIPKDGRGHATDHGIDPRITAKLIDVVKRLPKYVSHYSRGKETTDNSVYLEPDCQWNKVYDLVSEELTLDIKMASKAWFYRKVGQLFPHVKAHTPSTDKCNTCSLLKLQGKTVELELHQTKADEMREKLDEDLHGKIKTVTFDLQQVQALPFIRENKAFYHRKTWLYTCGVHEGNDKNQANMFIWPETMASRGAREIASTMYKYLNLNKEEITRIDTLINWSDACGGQNRNFIMVCFWLRVLYEFDLSSIHHCFPESGHSFLPSDRDFADFEKQKKKKDSIYTIEQYKEVHKKAKKQTPNVIEMSTDDFLDFSKGINFVNQSKPVDNDGNKFNWLKIHEFKFEKGLFGFRFRYNINDEFRTALLGPKRTNLRPNPQPVFDNPPIMYPEGINQYFKLILD